MRDSRRWLVLASAAVLATAGFCFGPSAARAMLAVPVAAQDPKPVLPTVLVVTPTRRLMARKLKVPATVEAYAVAELRARATGVVHNLSVEIGQPVAAGEVLLQLDAPELLQQREQASAELAAQQARVLAAQAALRSSDAALQEALRLVEVAKATAERAAVSAAQGERVYVRRKELHNKQAITDEAMEDAESQWRAVAADLRVAEAKTAAAAAFAARVAAERDSAHANIKASESLLAVAQAALAQQQARLEFTQLRAPFAGVIAARAVELGNLVVADAGPPLFALHRLDRVRVAFSVPEVDQPFVAAGTKVLLQLVPLGADPMASSVARIAQGMDPNSRTMRAEIDLDNLEQKLLHGMLAKVEVQLDPHAQALTVPAQALLGKVGQTHVYVVRDGVALRQAVTTGHDDGIHTEIRSGLADGDLVVVAGQGLLAPDQPVQAVLRKESP